MSGMFHGCSLMSCEGSSMRVVLLREETVSKYSTIREGDDQTGVVMNSILLKQMWAQRQGKR